MSLEVFLPVALRRESLVAHRARVGALTGVEPHVDHQIRLPLVGLVAPSIGASVLRRLSVGRLVLPQVPVALERAAAALHLAVVPLGLVLVDLFVLLQMRLQFESLLARRVGASKSANVDL